jgi:hypothetical protein
MPLAVYFFVLAQLNRRPHPVMVNGVWDFAGILFALSGFLLLGGPFIMASLNQDWRDFWVWSSLRSFEGLSGQWWYLRLLIWGLYFLAVAGGAGLLLRWRSYVTCVYNVVPEVLDQALGEALDRLQLSWRRSWNRVHIGPPIPADGQAIPQEEAQWQSTKEAVLATDKGFDTGVRSSILEPQSSSPISQRPNDRMDSSALRTVVELDPFPAMHHVTLRWLAGGGALRKEVEATLAKVLAEGESTYNPAAVWLMSVATVLLSTVTFGLLMLILFVVLVLYGN